MHKHIKRRSLSAALRVTIPVMLGYLFIGFAFGMLFEQSGYHFLWAVLMSILVFAGSMQFVAVSFLTGGFSLLTVALITLMINSRHLFYGLTMLQKFSDIRGAKKAYLIFSLTDETYALLSSQSVPDGVDKEWYTFFVAFLNHAYWVIGTLVGSVASSFIVFDSRGIAFAMTALFIVILIEQLKSTRRYAVAATGAGCAVLCLILFGKDAFLLPAMMLLTLIVMIFRRYFASEQEDAHAR